MRSDARIARFVRHAVLIVETLIGKSSRKLLIALTVGAPPCSASEAGPGSTDKAPAKRSLASAAAAFFYVRVIVVMYFHEPDSDSAHVVHPSVLAATAIGIAAAATLALGVLPGPVLDLTRTAGEFIR